MVRKSPHAHARFAHNGNNNSNLDHNHRVEIIESIDSISRDEQDVPLTQYITNA